LDKIFFVINVEQSHWVVVVGYMQLKRIQFYDSCVRSGLKWLNHVFQYIKDEHLDKKKASLPDEDEWELVDCVFGTPSQRNGKRADLATTIIHWQGSCTNAAMAWLSALNLYRR
jgi:Ulp1 family protease